MTDTVKKRIDAQAILSSDKSDDLKLFELFQIYKDDLRHQNTELYYALLGWKNRHLATLLKESRRTEVVEIAECYKCPKDVAAVGTNGKERHNVNEI